MKLLINICAHDGIISHYTGVGTMVIRYIEQIQSYCKHNKIKYELNLFTPQYNPNSFGFSQTLSIQHSKNKKISIHQISNGSNGDVNFGSIQHWKKLSKNTAKSINDINFNDFDEIITICNDTPYAGIMALLKRSKNHKVVWIPHSSIKIHKVDSAILDSEKFYDERLNWEQDAINYINKNENNYLGSIGEYFKNHLINEYGLLKEKSINIINGEQLGASRHLKNDSSCKKYFKRIKNVPELIISFGRAEEYKNLEATMELGYAMGVQSLVIAQSYYPQQSILKEYKEKANQTGCMLLIDPPFNLPKYIIKNFKHKLIVLIPSKQEIFGLIVNEVRKFNKKNVLVAANNIGGLKEQIEDGVDGVLLNLNDIDGSKIKLSKFLDEDKIKTLNFNSQQTLHDKYNFKNNFDDFMRDLLFGGDM